MEQLNNWSVVAETFKSSVWAVRHPQTFSRSSSLSSGSGWGFLWFLLLYRVLFLLRVSTRSPTRSSSLSAFRKADCSLEEVDDEGAIRTPGTVSTSSSLSCSSREKERRASALTGLVVMWPFSRGSCVGVPVSSINHSISSSHPSSSMFTYNRKTKNEWCSYSFWFIFTYCKTYQKKR